MDLVVPISRLLYVRTKIRPCWGPDHGHSDLLRVKKKKQEIEANDGAK